MSQPQTAPILPANGEIGAWSSPDELRGRLLELDRVPARSSWIDSYAYDAERQILYIWYFQVKGVKIKNKQIIDPGHVVGVIGFAYPDVPTWKPLELDSTATGSKGLWAYYNTIMTENLTNKIPLGTGWNQVGTYVPNTQRIAPLTGNEIRPDSGRYS